MKSIVKNLQQPCPECNAPLIFVKLSRDYENRPPLKLVGCPTCGIGNPTPDGKVVQIAMAATNRLKGSILRIV